MAATYLTFRPPLRTASWIASSTHEAGYSSSRARSSSAMMGVRGEMLSWKSPNALGRSAGAGGGVGACSAGSGCLVLACLAESASFACSAAAEAAIWFAAFASSWYSASPLAAAAVVSGVVSAVVSVISSPRLVNSNSPFGEIMVFTVW